MQQWMVAVVIGMAVAVPAAAAPAGGEIIAAINRVRADPPGFARQLQDYRRHFRGRLVDDGSPGGVLTREGVKAVDEAIAVLERQPPLPPLGASALLAAAAQDHVDDQGPRGLTGHQSASGATPSARVVARGGGPYIAETIAYGSATAAAVVRQLIVDDGVKDRGHRRALLAPDLRFAGAGCGPHAEYGVMCVVDFGRTADGRPK